MRSNAFAISLVAVILPTAALAAPVDLSPWLQDGGGSWSLEAGNNAVSQSQNAAPGVYHNNQSSQGKALSGTIEVKTTADDDFIGFVLGYSQGDIGGGAVGQNYLLIDWKQGTQSGWNAGMSISHVTGDIATCGTCTNSDAWQHTGSVDFLTRSNAAGANYANTGWADNTAYTFDLQFTASNVKIFVDNNLELDVTATDFGLPSFADGAFGFYGFSQQTVRYAGITQVTLPPSTVPVPASLPLLAVAIGGLGLAARRRRRA